MITTIVNGITITSETITEVHSYRSYYEVEEYTKRKRSNHRKQENDTLTELMREVYKIIHKN